MFEPDYDFTLFYHPADPRRLMQKSGIKRGVVGQQLSGTVYDARGIRVYFKSGIVKSQSETSEGIWITVKVGDYFDPVLYPPVGPI